MKHVYFSYILMQKYLPCNNNDNCTISYTVKRPKDVHVLCIWKESNYKKLIDFHWHNIPSEQYLQNY